MQFTSSTAGQIVGVRFHKGSGNTGSHIGHLWTADGTLLGTVTFSGETASGWQEARFVTPVAIAANTAYVVSYLAPNGGYSYTAGMFDAAPVVRGPLQGLANGSGVGNGVFLYGTNGGFPAGAYGGSCYLVDVIAVYPP